ncbi:hypothetical protein Tco_1138719 [Tanacetum coccineum]
MVVVRGCDSRDYDGCCGHGSESDDMVVRVLVAVGWRRGDDEVLGLRWWCSWWGVTSGDGDDGGGCGWRTGEDGGCWYGTNLAEVGAAPDSDGAEPLWIGR